jgi:hypothetical protein
MCHRLTMMDVRQAMGHDKRGPVAQHTRAFTTTAWWYHGHIRGGQFPRQIIRGGRKQKPCAKMATFVMEAAQTTWSVLRPYPAGSRGCTSLGDRTTVLLYIDTNAQWHHKQGTK